MEPGIVPSIESVRRTVAAELAYTMSRMQVLESLPGNPVGIAYRPLGHGAVALMARHFPNPSFSTVVGLNREHAGTMATVLAAYREHGSKPRFEIVPGLDDGTLARELAGLGLVPCGPFHTSMIGTARPEPAPDPRVEQVTDDTAMEAFLDAYVAGWGIAAAQHAQFKANVRPWRHRPDWTLYLGRVEGAPAAAAIVYIKDGVAYLADAATAPAFRGRGLQSALLRRRMATAAARGVDFVCSGAEFLSGSQRNMARAGLRLQFVRTYWTLP